METFDVAGARKAGYSDEDIARHLGKEHGFDADGALKAGYQPAELIKEMGTRGERSGFDSFVNSVKEFASELNPIKIATGMADTVRATYTDQTTGKPSLMAPFQLAKNISERNLQSLHEAQDEWKKGNYSAAALHAFNYLAPFGSALDDMQNDAAQGHIARSLGKATSFGVQMAAPSSPLVKGAIAKIPDVQIPGFRNANPAETAAVDFGKQQGIPVNAGMATGNKFVQGVQKAADHTPLGSVVAGAAEKTQADAFSRVGNQLADQAHPTSVSPTEAGRSVTSDIESTIEKHHAEADKQYSILRDIEADPVNMRNVQVGTKEIPYIDEKTGMAIPGKTRTVPDMQDVALPVDLTQVKKMLRPIYDQFQRQLPGTKARASTGLKAIENIVNGRDAESASTVDRDLSAIKAAARGNDEIPELRSVSQGLAAKAVSALHDAVTDAVSKAERTAKPGAAPPSPAAPAGAAQPGVTPAGAPAVPQKPGMIYDADEYGDVVSQPAIDTPIDNAGHGKLHAATTGQLSEDARDSLRWYQGGGDKIINGELRKGTSPAEIRDIGSQYTGEHFGNIEQAFKDVPPLKEDLIVYRGASNAADASGSRGYLSASTSREVAEKAARGGMTGGNSSQPGSVAEIRIPAGTRVLPLQNINGEQEVLLPRDFKAATPATAKPRSAETTVTVPGEPDNVYKARYEVRELGDVQSSHNGQTFAANPKYSVKNDRNYSNAVNQRKVVDWSTEKEFDPSYHVTDNPDATNGPPVIDSQGNVLGGNGRTMILDRVYKGNPKGAAAYKAQLADRAAQFGIDPESITSKRQPVLVRVIDDAELPTAEAKQAAVTDFNKTGTAALTPAEQAIADSRRVSPATMDHVAGKLDAAGESGTLAQILEGDSGREIGHKLIEDGVITKQDGAKFITETGLTKAGKERISQLMLGRFFRDPEQFENLPAAPRNKLERIAAPLARTEAEGEYNLTPHVQSAIDLLETARSHGSTVGDYLHQSGLFTEQRYSPEAVALAKHLADTNPVALTDMVRKYAEAAKYAGDYSGPGLYGDLPEPQTPKQAFNEAFGIKEPKILYHGTSAPEFSRFKGDLAYLAEDPAETHIYAENNVVGGGRGAGKPRTLRVEAAHGTTKDISAAVEHELMEGDGELDAAVEQEAKKARSEGHSYVSFNHPSSNDLNDSGEFKAIVSLHPQRDLRIAAEPGAPTAPAAAAAVPQKSADFDAAFAPPPPPAAPPPRVPGVPAGREAMNALGAGRAATAAKHDAAGVLKSLPRSGEEGKAVFDSAVWRKDGGIEHLKELKRMAPAQIPKIARAYIEQLLEKATTEGGFSKAKSIQTEWLNLGKETKELLYPNPMMREGLDNFFRLARMAGENPNPSGTAVLKVAVGAGTWILANPATGIPATIATGVLAKLLHSPKGVAALTAGLKVSLANKAAATLAASRIATLVQEIQKPQAAAATAYPKAAELTPSEQTDQPLLTASR